MTIIGSGVTDLPVLAYTDLIAPVVSPVYQIDGLVLTLPEGISLPSAIDTEGNAITTTFLSIITLTNTGDENIKLKHNSKDCLVGNKMFFVPANDYTLQSKNSITLIYRQIPDKTGWWYFKT